VVDGYEQSGRVNRWAGTPGDFVELVAFLADLVKEAGEGVRLSGMVAIPGASYDFESIDALKRELGDASREVSAVRVSAAPEGVLTPKLELWLLAAPGAGVDFVVSGASDTHVRGAAQRLEERLRVRVRGRFVPSGLVAPALVAVAALCLPIGAELVTGKSTRGLGIGFLLGGLAIAAFLAALYALFPPFELVRADAPRGTRARRWAERGLRPVVFLLAGALIDRVVSHL